jgi:branched-chain amino acid transport system substrate-binding protein
MYFWTSRKLRAGTCLAALGLLAAACGSSSPSSTATTTGTQGSTGGSTAASKLSGTPLVFGIVASESGPSGTTDDISVTASRWTSYINSHGGVNGHPVKVYVLDDTDSSAVAIQDAQQLIQSDHVVALGDGSQTGTAFASVADQAKIPVISVIGAHLSPLYMTDPNLFPTEPEVASWEYMYPQLAKLSGDEKMGLLYCAEVAACKEFVPVVTNFAKKVPGVSVVYSAAFSASQPSYTAICLAAEQAGANSIVAAGPDPTSTLRVFSDCSQQGYHPAAFIDSSGLGTEAVNDKDITVWGFAGNTPWFVRNSATAVFHQVMDSYLPSSVSPPTVMNTWVALEAFATAASHIPASVTPTAQDIYSGLYSFKGQTLGGLSIPLTYTQGKPALTQCMYPFKEQNGVLSTPFGLKLVCANTTA